jgi:hypothetical protein
LPGTNTRKHHSGLVFIAAIPASRNQLDITGALLQAFCNGTRFSSACITSVGTIEHLTHQITSQPPFNHAARPIVTLPLVVDDSIGQLINICDGLALRASNNSFSAADRPASRARPEKFNMTRLTCTSRISAARVTRAPVQISTSLSMPA